MTNEEKYIAIKAILDVPHPGSGAWNLDDALALAQAEAEDIVRDRSTLTPQEILETILNNIAEWDNNTADEQQMVRDILNIYTDGIPTKPNNHPARVQLVAILKTATKAELAALIPETVSIITDSKLGAWTLGDIQNARAL